MKKLFSVAAFFWACTFTQQAPFNPSSNQEVEEGGLHVLLYTLKDHDPNHIELKGLIGQGYAINTHIIDL